MAKKEPKERAEKYNEKLKVNGSFDDLMGALFPKAPTPKKKAAPKKAAKKKK